MSKYIVKNCPCFIDFDEQSLFENLCKNGGNCKDCNDCVMKQIVKKCRKSLEVSYCPIEQEILELLDIHEVGT